MQVSIHLLVILLYQSEFSKRSSSWIVNQCSINVKNWIQQKYIYCWMLPNVTLLFTADKLQHRIKLLRHWECIAVPFTYLKVVKQFWRKSILNLTCLQIWGDDDITDTREHFLFLSQKIAQEHHLLEAYHYFFTPSKAKCCFSL